MKFLITAVPMSPSTRRRIGKATTEVVDTTRHKKFKGLTTVAEVEARYEQLIKTDGFFNVKVVDIRVVAEYRDTKRAREGLVAGMNQPDEVPYAALYGYRDQDRHTHARHRG